MALVKSNKTRLLIGGELVEPLSGEWMDAENPATEEIIGQIPVAGNADVGRAVDAATMAQPAWAELSVSQRAAYMTRLIAAIEERADEIADVEAIDAGIVRSAVITDITKTRNGLEYYAGAARSIAGETPAGISSNIHMTLREPYGVVGRIAPFNHPFMFLAARAGAPLMMGNTVVAKAPETASLSAQILSEICVEILPPGVFNIVTGPGVPTGTALVQHPAVKRIAFTGSTQTGMAIQAAAAASGVKNITLELGGKNPMIVCPSADIEAAAKAAIRAMNFGWQGQSCGSLTRIYIHEDVYSAFSQAVADGMSRLRLGDPLDANTDVGPVNSRKQFERINAYIESARNAGANTLVGGTPADGHRKGYWIPPTLFGSVTHDMAIAREEVFGPVLSLLKWRDFDQVISMANDSELALSATVWTADLGEALKFVRRVRAGVIWVNGAGNHYYGLPFGGMRNSGTGREECLEELESYTEVKSVTLARQEP